MKILYTATVSSHINRFLVLYIEMLLDKDIKWISLVIVKVKT